MTLLQALLFQKYFRDFGPTRGVWFDDGYQRVFAVAVSMPVRPIYLVDGYYIHAYWYAAVKGIDLSNFVHISDGARPPVGSLVISAEDENQCTRCEIIMKDDKYLLYWSR
jgi:hypothetical protein